MDMLSQRLQDALNAQINAEFWSAYLYLSMSMDCAAKGLKGTSHWFSVQFREEQDHARILIDYMLSRGGVVKLAPIAEVRTSWNSPLEAFEETLAHERRVTAMFDELCRLAAEEHDYATANRLVWFVDEQIEEESEAQEKLDALRAVEGNKFGIYMLDKELGARTYAPAAPLAAQGE